LELIVSLLLNKKKYVVLSQNEYNQLRKKAALKVRPEEILSTAEARAYSKSLIRQLGKES
jgi:hypothetical protein